MTGLELTKLKQELKQEKEKALNIARENIKKAQLELEQIVQYYNQLGV